MRRSLLRSVPRVDEARKSRLVGIRGLPPDLVRMPPGCTFHPRCAFRVDRCSEEEPSLQDVGPDQRARCWVMMRNVPPEATEELKATDAPVREAAREIAKMDATDGG